MPHILQGCPQANLRFCRASCNLEMLSANFSLSIRPARDYLRGAHRPVMFHLPYSQVPTVKKTKSAGRPAFVTGTRVFLKCHPTTYFTPKSFCHAPALLRQQQHGSDQDEPGLGFQGSPDHTRAKTLRVVRNQRLARKKMNSLLSNLLQVNKTPSL